MHSFIGCFGAMCVASLVVSPLRAGDSDDLELVFRKWRQRQQQTKSVQYVTQGAHIITKGRYNAERPTSAVDDLPADDLHMPKKVTWTIDFEHGWLRKEQETETFDFLRRKPRPFFAIDVFDGQNMRRFTPRDKNTGGDYVPAKKQPDLQFKAETYRQYFLLAPDYPVFLAHGSIPTVYTVPSPGTVTIPLQKENFVVHGRAILNGHDCVVLKTATPRDAVDEYWIDISKDAAVRRFARYAGDTLGQKRWVKIDIDYDHVDHGWLPSKWTVIHYYPERRTVETVESLTVLSAVTNVLRTVDDFRVEPGPGQVVEDVAKNKYYQVEDDGTLQEYADGTLGIRSVIWSVGIIGVAVGAIAIVVLVRRKGRARAQA